MLVPPLEAGMNLLLATQGCLLCVSLFPFIPQTIEFDESAGAVLRIQPLRTPRDENIYECVAQNPHGEVTVHAKLTVLRGKEHACLPCVSVTGRRDPSASPFLQMSGMAITKLAWPRHKVLRFSVGSDLPDLLAVTSSESHKIEETRLKLDHFRRFDWMIPVLIVPSNLNYPMIMIFPPLQ